MSSKQHYEIEIKFPLRDTQEIRKNLLSLGFIPQEKLFEYNLVLDTPQGGLHSRKRLLRLRKDNKVTLTYKEPIEGEKKLKQRYKARKEIELEVSDLETMRHILHRLGFSSERVYEKYREHFTSENNIIAEIDRLPHMGFFLELEGEPEKIEEVAASLGLDVEQGLRQNYFELYRDYCMKVGREPGDMRFEDEKQQNDTWRDAKERKIEWNLD